MYFDDDEEEGMLDFFILDFLFGRRGPRRRGFEFEREIELPRRRKKPIEPEHRPGDGHWTPSDDLYLREDDDKPAVVRYAEKGNVDGIKAQITAVRKLARKAKKSKKKEKLDKNLRLLLNETQRWTEREKGDGDGSDYARAWEWHNLTPLATAAINGQIEVVHLLLETGVADPTLYGCPRQQEFYNAFQAAEIGGCEVIMAMLQAVKPFWNVASYNGMAYSKDRVNCGFSNSCTDLQAMRRALAAAFSGGSPVPMLQYDGL